MKRFIILIVVLISLSVQSQNEIKVDVFDLTIFKALDISYQYNLNEEASVGVSIFKNIDDKDNVFNDREDFTITPYYRQYFSLGSTENVYIEGFVAINSGKDYINSEIIATDGTGSGVFLENEIKYTDAAFGFVFGKSFVSPRGFVLDLYAGLGRNLFDSDGSPSIVPRLGINTGFRF